ncbi:late control protein [Variovorax paradoxus]|uniref:Late control protein n=1 Tax=Variovorax paradoxus TaxID=34073 RepID=A0AA91DHD5_VARPD|nr:late control protein [Variovorax paradoxus]
MRQGHPAPSYRLKIGDRDITPAIDARLISLTLTECRGDEADQLDIVLSDHDGALEIPARGRELQLAIGWTGTDLVDKGTFIVDEAEHSGAPDQICIRARSADMHQSLRTRVERSYHGVTVGEIVRQTAARHQLVVRIDPDLGARQIEHIDQTNESDLNFITRLAKLHDAVATIKRGRLLFLPIVGTTTSTGESIPLIEITRADGDMHRYHTSDRDAYSGVRAYWHDPKRAKRCGVLVGKSGNAKRLKDTFANEADARAAAQAEWRRIQRGLATFNLTLALGQPMLISQTPVKVSGWKLEIDDTEWLTIKVRHTMTQDGGFTTVAEMEVNAIEQVERSRFED